jgi:hypothetical protein
MPTRRRVDLAGFALISGWIDPRLFDGIVVDLKWAGPSTFDYMPNAALAQ